jgi:protein SCO1/2
LSSASLKPLCLRNFDIQHDVMSKKLGLYLLFFFLLAIGFYATLAVLIPGYTKKGVAPVSYVRPFRFLTQDSTLFSEQDIKGKVYVASYFFTTCKGICPRMNNYLRTVYDELHTAPGFLIVSHTCDPETDSVSQLKRYADSLQVDTRKWIFLTGRKDSLYYAARISYTIDDPANNLTSIEDDFLHTQFFALVDKNGDVKKIYDGLKESEVKELIADARKLLEEKN